MNEYNQKRLVKALDDLNTLEEEILPCWAEENGYLRKLCEEELFSDSMIHAEERVNTLEAALKVIRDCKAYLNFVIDSNKKDSS